MRVLIIESDLAFASTLRQALEARGVEVETTADGKRGVELAHEKRPAAVVLAVELGDRLTGGFSWCNKFKRDESLKTIPLLLTSSLATEQTFEQHRKLKTRADHYLLKPFGPRDLLERLEPYLPRPPAPEDGDGTVDLVGELLADLEKDAPNEAASIASGSANGVGQGAGLEAAPASDDGVVLDLDAAAGAGAVTGDEAAAGAGVLPDDEAAAGAEATEAAPLGDEAAPPEQAPGDGAGVVLEVEPAEDVDASFDAATPDAGGAEAAPAPEGSAEAAEEEDDDTSIEIDDGFDILSADLVDELEFTSAGPDAAIAAAMSDGLGAPPVADHPWPDSTPSPGAGSGAGRLAEAETRLATLATELEASRKEAAELRSQLGAAHTELAMSKGEAMALQERLTALEAELADQKDRGELLARRIELEASLRKELRAALATALARLDDVA